MIGSRLTSTSGEAVTSEAIRAWMETEWASTPALYASADDLAGAAASYFALDAADPAVLGELTALANSVMGVAAPAPTVAEGTLTASRRRRSMAPSYAQMLEGQAKLQRLGRPLTRKRSVQSDVEDRYGDLGMALVDAVADASQGGVYEPDTREVMASVISRYPEAAALYDELAVLVYDIYEEMRSDAEADFGPDVGYSTYTAPRRAHAKRTGARSTIDAAGWQEVEDWIQEVFLPENPGASSAEVFRAAYDWIRYASAAGGIGVPLDDDDTAELELIIESAMSYAGRKAGSARKGKRAYAYEFSDAEEPQRIFADLDTYFIDACDYVGGKNAELRPDGVGFLSEADVPEVVQEVINRIAEEGNEVAMAFQDLFGEMARAFIEYYMGEGDAPEAADFGIRAARPVFRTPHRRRFDPFAPIEPGTPGGDALVGRMDDMQELREFAEAQDPSLTINELCDAIADYADEQGILWVEDDIYTIAVSAKARQRKALPRRRKRYAGYPDDWSEVIQAIDEYIVENGTEYLGWPEIDSAACLDYIVGLWPELDNPEDLAALRGIIYEHTHSVNSVPEAWRGRKARRSGKRYGEIDPRDPDPSEQIEAAIEAAGLGGVQSGDTVWIQHRDLNSGKWTAATFERWYVDDDYYVAAETTVQEGEWAGEPWSAVLGDISATRKWGYDTAALTARRPANRSGAQDAIQRYCTEFVLAAMNYGPMAFQGMSQERIVERFIEWMGERHPEDVDTIERLGIPDDVLLDWMARAYDFGMGVGSTLLDRTAKGSRSRREARRRREAGVIPDEMVLVELAFTVQARNMYGSVELVEPEELYAALEADEYWATGLPFSALESALNAALDLAYDTERSNIRKIRSFRNGNLNA